MSPDMAGFGFIFFRTTQIVFQSCFECVFIEMAKTRPVRGPSLQKSASERDWGIII
jgi:hypothetical protein